MRRLDGGPNLVVVARDGDPRVAVALALSASDAPAPIRAALAEVVARRVPAGEVTVRADGDALRVTWLGATGELAPALAEALRRPIDATEVEAAPVRAALERAARAPRPPEAMRPIARCVGRAIVDTPAVEADAVEDLRGRLSASAMALAIVGPRADAEALARRLADESWPPGTAIDATDWRPSHEAHATDGTELTVDVALRVGSAEAALGAARRFESPSPLSQQLALLDPPWEIAAVTAHAAPRGACLRVVITPHEDLASWPTPAGVAARLTVDELTREVARPSSGERTRAVLTAGDAATTAEVAAWWALHEEVADAPVPMTAVSVPGRLPLSPNDPSLGDDERSTYRATVEAPRTTVGSAPPRVVVERGQGELWMLAAQPCAVRAESTWDWGRAALAATAAASEHTGQVPIEPWVTSEGVGLLAHDAPREGEAPEALARRVGDALGAALTALPRDPRRFAPAQRRVLEHVASEPLRALAAIARQRSADHPSELAPWGPVATQVTLLDTQRRWRALLGGPWRLALHVRRDETEAEAAVAAFERWYRPPAVEVTCPVGAPPAFEATPETIDDVEPEGLLAVAAPGAGAAAVVVEHALNGTGGLLRGSLAPVGWRGTARLVGAGARRTLVILARGAPPERAEARRRLEGLLRTLAQDGLTAPTLARALERRDSRADEDRAHPAGRVAATWRGDHESPPAVDGGAVSSYCGDALVASELTWIADGAITPE